MVKPIAAVVMSSPTRNSARLIAYALTEKDGQAKGDRFVAASGINGCIPEFAEGQFRDNRKRWRKDGTRTVKVQWGTDKVTGQPTYRDVTEGAYVQAYHVIQSFARDGAGRSTPTIPTTGRRVIGWARSWPARSPVTIAARWSSPRSMGRPAASTTTS